MAKAKSLARADKIREEREAEAKKAAEAKEAEVKKAAEAKASGDTSKEAPKESAEASKGTSSEVSKEASGASEAQVEKKELKIPEFLRPASDEVKAAKAAEEAAKAQAQTQADAGNTANKPISSGLPKMVAVSGKPVSEPAKDPQVEEISEGIKSEFVKMADEAFMEAKGKAAAEEEAKVKAEAAKASGAAPVQSGGAVSAEPQVQQQPSTQPDSQAQPQSKVDLSVLGPTVAMNVANMDAAQLRILVEKAETHIEDDKRGILETEDELESRKKALERRKIEIKDDIRQFKVLRAYLKEVEAEEEERRHRHGVVLYKYWADGEYHYVRNAEALRPLGYNAVECFAIFRDNDFLKEVTTEKELREYFPQLFL